MIEHLFPFSPDGAFPDDLTVTLKQNNANFRAEIQWKLGKYSGVRNLEASTFREEEWDNFETVMHRIHQHYSVVGKEIANHRWVVRLKVKALEPAQG